MFWPENLLPDLERFLVERLDLSVVPDLLEKEPEVIQGIGCLGVLLTPSALCYCQPLFLQWGWPPHIFLVQTVGQLVD